MGGGEGRVENTFAKRESILCLRPVKVGVPHAGTAAKVLGCALDNAGWLVGAWGVVGRGADDTGPLSLMIVQISCFFL